MSDSYDDIAFKFIECLKHLTTVDEVFANFIDAVKVFGVTTVGITDLDHNLYATPDDIYRHNWDEEWFKRYGSQVYIRTDPMALKALVAPFPFYWGEVDSERYSEAKRVLGEASEFGISDGFVVPIHDTVGKTGIVALSGESLDHSPRASYAMHTMTLYGFNRIRELREAPEAASYHITPRQEEVLRWVGLGKTYIETGAILGITDRTARLHFSKVQKELLTGTRIETINKARSLKLI